MCAFRVSFRVRTGFKNVFDQASLPCTNRLQNPERTLQRKDKVPHRFLVRDLLLDQQQKEGEAGNRGGERVVIYFKTLR